MSHGRDGELRAAAAWKRCINSKTQAMWLKTVTGCLSPPCPDCPRTGTHPQPYRQTDALVQGLSRHVRVPWCVSTTMGSLSLLGAWECKEAQAPPDHVDAHPSHSQALWRAGGAQAALPQCCHPQWSSCSRGGRSPGRLAARSVGAGRFTAVGAVSAAGELPAHPLASLLPGKVGLLYPVWSCSTPHPGCTQGGH